MHQTSARVATPARARRAVPLRAALALLVAIFVGFVAAALPARADGPSPADARALRIERSLACPQCTDLPLDVCDRDICSDMRTIIQQKVVAGESDQAIRQYFVARYGSRVLLAPPKSSFNLLAWVMPFIGLAAGGLAVFLFLRSARGRSQAPPPAADGDAALGAYRARAEREAEQYE